MVKKTEDKLFYCGKAHQLLKLLAEINKESITLKDYLKSN
ncbi:hypothetical protein JOC73_000533 [Alkaliphilus hydrothermalis]|uniref:Uncharacterized protein n=1 Tax=Alkaliphilus hydrothermalis TaxID=1482730 RepID=A0ABS2NM62_9FIRM|nr:hypothetical protein [Alkaliphilus hydrothermalis]